MRNVSPLQIKAQPTPDSCGPTCLAGLYNYFSFEVSVESVIASTSKLVEGGTILPFMGIDALRRDFEVTIYPFDVRIFDPTWKTLPSRQLAAKIVEALDFRLEEKTKLVSKAYAEFLSLGGRICFEDLSAALLEQALRTHGPIITGVNATYLYQCAREYEKEDRIEYDDVRGHGLGHFVVIHDVDRAKDLVTVADPQLPNPLSESDQNLTFSSSRVLNAILLGAMTFDSGLLCLRPQA